MSKISELNKDVRRAKSNKRIALLLIRACNYNLEGKISTAQLNEVTRELKAK